MKITMYELLGMVKDGKAPKKIMFLGNTYRYDEIDKTYRNIIGNTNIGEMHNLEFYLDDEIEILEEEKKIPEKLEEFGLIQYNLDYIDYKNIETLKEWLNKDFQTIYDTLDLIIKNQNKLIDYLKSKGE